MLISQSGRMKNAILDCKPEYNILLVITREREWDPAYSDKDLGCLKALSGGSWDKKYSVHRQQSSMTPPV